MEPHDIKALKERIGDRMVVASVSGGKDSTAMCLYLQELGIPYRAVHMDTGWEHADTDRYVKEVLPKYIGPITTISANLKPKPGKEAVIERFERMLGRESQMIRLVLNRGYMPSRIARFCTIELKMDVMRAHLDTLDGEPVSTTGVRAVESAKRSAYPEWEWWDKADCDQWRPILKWADQDVVDIHTRHGVPPNPLYLRGAHRVGCWPCIYARKAEIRNISETDPKRIDLMEQLEIEVTKMVKVKMKAKGKSTDFEHSGWFWNHNHKVDPETGKAIGGAWRIRDVVDWSRTKRGGKQFDLFAPPAREWGCMRWGVCDTGTQEE